jgi:hypothetical protein
MDLTTELSMGNDGWALRVKTPAGVALEYRYATEQQARFMAAIFALGPSRLPPALRVVATSRRRTRANKRPAELLDVTEGEIDDALVALAS